MIEWFGADGDVKKWLLMGCFSFFAGLIDSVAGGGGLIQLPALMAFFPNLPVVVLLGTNKLASSCGTALAAVRFSREVEIRWRSVLPMASVALIAAIFGALIAVNVPNERLRPFVVALLSVVLVYTLLNRSLGEKERKSPATPAVERLLGLTAALGIGLYDGFFGPGTGNFLILTMIFIFGIDFVHASASSKVVNLATNIGALILFFSAGTINVPLGLTMALFNMAGAFFGVKLAVLKGSKFIRVLFMATMLGLLSKQAIDLFQT